MFETKWLSGVLRWQRVVGRVRKYSKSPCSFACRERNDARIDIVNFGGDKKWCLWKAC